MRAYFGGYWEAWFDPDDAITVTKLSSLMTPTHPTGMMDVLVVTLTKAGVQQVVYVDDTHENRMKLRLA